MGACAVVQSVELLLDPVAEAAVLAEWQALDQAGLPSQTRNTSPSNRPHVTLVAVTAVDTLLEMQIGAVCAQALPLDVWVGAVTIFGRDPYVLVRSVVAATELLAVQAQVARLLEVPPDALSAPGRWVPHVTLARRMTADQVAAALPLLSAGALPVRLDRARRWDGDARREWPLA